MKKIILLLTTLSSLSLTAFAQFPYTVSVQSQAYVPLTNATNVNGSTIWDEENYALPLPFSFKIGAATVSRFNLRLSIPGATTDTQGLVNGFILGGIDLADRGLLAGTASLSPISYVTTGVAPNRIFKLELNNAGFFDESDLYNTMNDSLNMQVWYYETSNIAEIHFGTSQVSHPQDYYFFGTGPLIGYAKNLDIDNSTFDAVYGLNGNTLNPTIDSINLAAQTAPSLATFPASGTVYRFTPKTTGPSGVGSIPAFANLQVYPTITSAALNVNYNDKATANYEVLAIDGRSTGISGSIINGTNRLDVNALAEGMYILKIENSSNRGVYRFSKK